MLKVDPHKTLDQNLLAIASYVEPSDVVVDVGGGAGRVSLPIALRCERVINVEPSAVMCAGFAANAARAGVTNTEIVNSEWLDANPVPQGTFALASHVLYLTSDIVAFIERLEQAGPRRVLITTNSPAPPSWHRVLFGFIHGEEEELVPGASELANTLWEMGRLPDIVVLPKHAANPVVPEATREGAVNRAITAFNGDQWALWPPAPELRQRIRRYLEDNFDGLFRATDAGYSPGWITPGREILITWSPGIIT